MKIDVEPGDTWMKFDDTSIVQYRGDKCRSIGRKMWVVGDRGVYEIPTTIEAARKNAESLGHELVMPEEKGPFYAVCGPGGKMRMYAGKVARDSLCRCHGWFPCSPTGEVIQ